MSDGIPRKSFLPRAASTVSRYSSKPARHARVFLPAGCALAMILVTSCGRKATSRFPSSEPSGEARSESAGLAATAPQDQSEAKSPGGPSPEEIQRQELEQQRQLEEESNRREQDLQARRDQARQAAVGQTMELLQTVDGKTYEKVVIREVSAVGISIRHVSGTARIPFEKLPDDMQRQYMFDPSEKNQLLSQERESHARHESEVVAASQTSAATAETRTQNAAQERRAKLARNLAIYDERIAVLEDEVRHLENDLAGEQNAVYHRSYRRHYYGDRTIGGVSKAPIVRQKLEEKRSQLSVLRQQAAALRADLNSLP